MIQNIDSNTMNPYIDSLYSCPKTKKKRSERNTLYERKRKNVSRDKVREGYKQKEKGDYDLNKEEELDFNN